MKRFLAIARARLIELLRDRIFLLWSLVFAPLLISAAVLGLTAQEPAVLHVGIVGERDLQRSALFSYEGIEFSSEPQLERALTKLRRHRLDLLLDSRVQPMRYWLNSDAQSGKLAERLLRMAEPAAERQTLTGPELRRADSIVPGMLAVNLVAGALIALGQIIVRYRKSGYLKRLAGTPLRPVEFIAAQMCASVLIVVASSAVIYGVADSVLHFHMQGSFASLLLVAVLGAAATAAVGLLVAARLSNEELAAGILTAVCAPMLLLSGLFIPLDSLPPALQWLAHLSPLTQTLEAAQAVMLEGAGLAEIARPLLILSATTTVVVLLASRMFVWTSR